jgi:predicted PurR-regulated permease PerM
MKSDLPESSAGQDHRQGRESDPSPRPGARDWFPRRQLPFWGLAGLTVVALGLCWELVRPFLSALLWAVAFAVLANPFFRWLCRKVRSRAVAAGVSVAVVALVLVLPTVALAPKLAGDAATAVNALAKSLEVGQWREKLGQVKAVGAAIAWVEANVDFREIAREAAHTLTSGVSSLVKGSLAGIVQAFVCAFLLFYLFRDQEAALTALKSLLPLTTSEAEMLFRRFSDTIYAIIYGKLFTAVAQGALGGIGFWMLGLTSPWFWGLVMGVLSFLPFVGASFVWGPAAIFLTLNGQLGKALLLVVWGVAVIAPIESFLYPIMIGQRLKLHNALVFIAVLGGLVAFGPVGLIVGPAILALTLGLLSLWKDRLAQSATAPSPDVGGQA